MNAHETTQRNIALYREYRRGKAAGLTQKALGERYGISQPNMSRILHKGEAWLATLRGIDRDGGSGVGLPRCPQPVGEMDDDDGQDAH
jgi:transcriptional regulator with XRE-family HTH domain